MFRWLLRQLHILQKIDGVRTIEYRCKQCNVYTTVILTQQEWNDLCNGIPFDNVFQTERKQSLIHFKKGLCANEHCQSK